MRVVHFSPDPPTVYTVYYDRVGRRRPNTTKQPEPATKQPEPATKQPEPAKRVKLASELRAEAAELLRPFGTPGEVEVRELAALLPLFE